MKYLTMFESYSDKEVIRKNGLKRVSRWITIQQNFNPGKRNLLWDYVIDGQGHSPYNAKFDSSDGLYLDYFRYNGRKYAIEQFSAFGSILDILGHSMGYFENGERHYLSGFDNTSCYNPYMIELDKYGDKVRIYELTET